MPILGSLAGASARGLGGLRTFGAAVAVDTGAMFAIQSVVVGSGNASTITFNSIPSTYSHLHLRITARSLVLERLNLRFNNDSGSTKYDAHRLLGDGSTVSSDARIDKDAIWLASAGPVGVTATALTFTTILVHIPDYTSTNKTKTVRAYGATDLNGSGAFEITSGRWKDSSAISRIDCTIQGSSFANGSCISLYGVKSA